MRILAVMLLPLHDWALRLGAQGEEEEERGGERDGQDEDRIGGGDAEFWFSFCQT